MGDQQSEEKWPEITRLVLSDDRLLLTLQSRAIRLVLQKTFTEVEALLVLENAFPDSVQRDEMTKRAMRSIVRELGPDFSDIRTRLKSDANYASILTLPVSPIPSEGMPWHLIV